MLPSPSASRPAGRVRGGLSLAAAAACGALVGAFAGCSTSDCKSMKGGGGTGGLVGDLVCGGQGTDAPKADDSAGQTNACSDFHKVMPQFFRLLEDPARPLQKLRDVVALLGKPQCLVPQKSCDADTVCPEGDCQADGKCPCTKSTSPLGSLLQVSFKALATISQDKVEPGAPGGQLCVSAQAAASLDPSQINRMCEVRRMLDVLVQQNGGQKLLDDPNVQTVVLHLIQYIEGRVDGSTHYELFSTLGRMAQNPGICKPSDAYDLLDRALAYYTPAKAASDLGAIQKLLADPITVDLLKRFTGNGGSAQGRAAIITLAHDLLGAVTSARSGSEATAQIDNLLQKIVYPFIEQNYGLAYENEVKAAAAALEGAIGADAGIFPYLQNLLICANNPVIDKNGELVGALYDLLTAQQQNGGLDLSTLVGALKTLTTLDGTGQVSRSLRLIIAGARNDDAATEAVRALLAQVLTTDIAQKLLPPLDVLVQKQVLGEVITLLDDLLYKCTPPPQH